MRRTLALAVCLATSGAVDAAPHAVPRYVAVPLGPSGAISIEARAINARGQALINVLTAAYRTRAFVVTGGVAIAIDVEGATDTMGYAINASGHVVGCAGAAGFVDRGGDVELVPVPGPYRAGCAVGINDEGQVVGLRYQVALFVPAASYRYFNGVFEDIPSGVNAISNRGDLVGTSQPHLAPMRAWAVIDGVPVSPGPVDVPETTALAINDRGDVVGWGYAGYLYSRGVVHIVPGPDGGSFASALGINNRGDVVGVAGSADGRGVAALYAGGTAYELTRLVVAGLDGATLTSAVGINDGGAIVANACAPGPPYPAPCKAFRLDPLPEAGDPANVPTLSHWALSLLALLVAACGLGVRHR